MYKQVLGGKSGSAEKLTPDRKRGRGKIRQDLQNKLKKAAGKERDCSIRSEDRNQRVNDEV